jgi:hypothetical protein
LSKLGEKLIAAARSATAGNGMTPVSALEQAISDYYFQTNFSRDDTALFADYITNWLGAHHYVIKRAVPPCRGHHTNED